MVRRSFVLFFVVALLLAGSAYPLRGVGVARAQDPSSRAPVGSTFTYQGRLTVAGAPAVGNYDFQFRLYDGPDAGSTQIGDTETRDDVTVTDGTFMVYLDFGSAAFDGESRWLEIAVRPSGPTDSASYNTLSPRQPLTPTPYALHAAEAGSVAWSGLTGVPSTLSFLAAPTPCVSGQVPKWDSPSSAWACAEDVDTDTNTTYSAGSGLDLTDTTFSVDTAETQTRVSDSCAVGSSIRAINEDGTVECEADTDTNSGDITGVTTGTGLSGGGMSGDVTVSADTSYLQRRVSDTCTAGSSISSIAVDGTVTCETDDAGPEPQQVVWVARSGGDFTSVQAALNSITDAAADNPYLIRIAPGVYTEQVTLKEHVALEGAGEGKTILRWTGGNTNPFDSGASATVIGANNAELRLLTIESVAGTGTQFAIALRNRSTSPTLIHVTATASGGSNSYGVYNNSSSPTMDNVSATASGASNTNRGVDNVSSSPTMTNVTATASGGNNSQGVRNDGSSPRMTNVTASASGGSINIGVFNTNSSSPMMTNVTATASGAGNSNNNGVYNTSSSPTMDNVTATASGGTNSYGVFNASSSSPTMDNVTATASGGSGLNIGVYNHAGVTTIRDSALTGSQSVQRDGGTVRVANSQLVGSVAGIVTCFNNYNANLAPVTCP